MTEYVHVLRNPPGGVREFCESEGDEDRVLCGATFDHTNYWSLVGAKLSDPENDETDDKNGWYGMTPTCPACMLLALADPSLVLQVPHNVVEHIHNGGRNLP
jgi:hypothetical protein